MNESRPHVIVGDVVQIAPNESVQRDFHGKLAFVDKVTLEGIQARIDSFRSDVYVPLGWQDFALIGHAVYIQTDKSDGVTT